MNRALIKKTVLDSLWLCLACLVTIVAFSWIRIVIVSSIEAIRFQKIANNLPDMVKRLSPVPIDDLINYPGLISFTWEEPMAYLIMAVWTITRASDAVSGELGRGTLEMILSQPVSRLNYLVTHTTITLLGVALLAGGSLAGTKVGIDNATVKVSQQSIRFQVPLFGMKLPIGAIPRQPKPVPMKSLVQTKTFVPATINYFCLGVMLTGVTTALSAVDRYRWRTIGIMVGFYVIQTVFELTGMAVEGWKWILHLTVFSVYEPVSFSTKTAKDPAFAWRFLQTESSGYLPDLGPLGCDVVLLLIGIAGIVIACRVFVKRDLPAPL